MSRGDWVSVFATAILSGVAYFVSGPRLAIGAIVFGLVGLAIVHFSGRLWDKRKEEPGVGDHDPCIIPRYDKSSNARAGINNSDWFVLENEGPTEGYDVTINEFQVGDTILRFGKVPMIRSKQYAIATQELFDIYQGKVPNYGLAVAFSGAWRANRRVEVGTEFRQSTSMKYRDRANNWIRTEFTMCYDARKDFINIENIKHSRLPSGSD